MQEDQINSGGTFFVRLSSGRVLGPINIERITQLIRKKRITGDEVARENPVGEWKPITQFPEINAIFVLKLGKGTVALPPLGSPLSGSALPGAGPQEIEAPPSGPSLAHASTENEVTIAVSRDAFKAIGDQDERTQVQLNPIELKSDSVPRLDDSERQGTFSREETIVISRTPSRPPFLFARGGEGRKGLWQKLKILVLIAGCGYFAYDTFLAEHGPARGVVSELIRPKLPATDRDKIDPNRSIQAYNEGIQFYLSDTVGDYKAAAEKFRSSVTFDPNNVKSLAMLASSYLNLIDTSNKDETYFDVLSRLIEMSRSKSIDLPETVIADVEFYIVVNKAEAAQTRVIEYTKSHSNYGSEMFYYLSLAFFARGDYGNAARFLEQFPDNKVFSAKIFYLKGQIAERLKDIESAVIQYNKAITFNPKHVKSRLRLAWILSRQNKIGNAAAHLNYNLDHSSFLSPVELGETYYLHSQLMSSQSNWKLANDDIERAVSLAPENHSYLLELYTLKARGGNTIQSVQGQARMYYFLGEGERLVQLGKYHDALIPFLQAREADDRSPIPPVKIGDMFSYLNDVENARKNYRLAADRAPNNIHIWSKYIKTLIQSFDWDEANKAMDRFRKLQVSQSAIDKAAADMYQQQGRFVDAQIYYKKAMARPSIDPEVYIAYARSLISTRNFKDAPFFFSLALRFDPLNVDAVIGIAKSVAETESIERAISLLQDELKGEVSARAEYLAAIAELQMQKGIWDLAQENIKQAIQINPDYAYAWKLQAQFYMSREFTDRQALEKALQAYKSYSERNISDPSGYLERYKIFVKRTEYEKAKDELTKIYDIYPKYPNLHYYLGALYALQGNHKVSTEEFKLEIRNNPLNFQALIAYGKELLELNDVAAFREGLNQFTRAMQVAPQSAEAKQNAGWANFKLQNYTAAVALIKEAIVLDRANPAHYRRLGIVYRDSGDMMSACAAFRKYLEMEPDATDKGSFQSCF